MPQSNCQSKIANKRIAGMSFIEVMVATAILVIAMLPMLFMLNSAIKNIVFSSKSSIASKLAQELMEEILTRERWDQNAQTGKKTSTYSTGLGPDIAETYPNFNDIDDYNGAAIPNVIIGQSVFQRTVLVTYVKVDENTGVITVPGGATDFKRITVSLTWEGNDKHPVTISTIVANVYKY